MATQERSDATPFYFALGGAIIGAVVALLLAPKKGSELREDIGELGRRAGEKSQELYSRVKEMVPGRMKVAAAVGAAEGVGEEALREAKKGVKSVMP